MLPTLGVLIAMVAYPFISLVYYSTLSFSVLRPLIPAKPMGLRNYELLLQDADTVLTLSPDHRALKDIGLKIGVAGLPTAAAEDAPALIGRSNREARAFAGSGRKTELPPSCTADLEVRAFAAATGIDEDPVTGSLNASLAQWLIADDRMPLRYEAAQGQCLGRDGRVRIERDDSGQVWVGGQSVICIDGTATL